MARVGIAVVLPAFLRGGIIEDVVGSKSEAGAPPTDIHSVAACCTL